MNLITNITKQYRITNPAIVDPSTIFVIVHGADGSIASFYELARFLNITVVAISYLPSVAGDCHTVEQFAAVYLHHLMEMYPNSSYVLSGHSFGGLVAYEMAALASEEKREKPPVFMIDPNLPLAMRGYHADRLIELRVLAMIAIPKAMTEKYDIYQCDEQQLFDLLSRCLRPQRIEEILNARKHCLAALSKYVYSEHAGLCTHMIHAGDKLEYNFTDQETKVIKTGRTVRGNHFTMLQAQHVEELANVINSNLGQYV